MTFSPGAGSSSTCDKFRKARAVTFKKRISAVTARPERVWASNAHRHDHGQVARPGLGSWTNHCRVELSAHCELDLFCVDGAQHVQEVAGVETDGELGPRV